MNTEGGTGPIADESCLTVVLTSCQYLPVSSERLPTLSQKERLILESLVDEPKFGLQLVEESGGRLKYGTVYVTLRLAWKTKATWHPNRRLVSLAPLACRAVTIVRRRSVSVC